ncbi:hypothetical protein SDRG_01734 [Saprolegnia diclina VS20]|uniref:Macro domain-containing protein n=1 Tax=Saprolegnia diclina (strain VS20) TaxID=1156394 RepID=T0R123_SAPDV|nr:hypothetical protein SDRG_01734 [Saprolegnia diclina VS20]EQC40656.1 hypothetical protein SDRG_01734 [Saprolegnia diclina VS20]|eukprot:XP_008605500.1 hypothetical protein SDRG_01734 [Saprolegnia diclina VS20]
MATRALETIARWGDASEGPTMAVSDAPFECNPALNAKVALLRHELWTLDVDAIVNPTNESLTDASGICGSILDAAGDQIYVECNASDPCRTGDAVMTRGCQLPAKKIIHTVGPRYNAKYKVAAENALHGCYRNALRVAKEERVRSIAFPPIYSKKKMYPRDDATHVALRTVRRFLEHYADDFDLIVFCVDDTHDMLLYATLLPLYFPRSIDELEASRAQFAAHREWTLGDAFGEPIIEERKIRIAPTVCPDNQLETNQSPGTNEFCAMTDNPDDNRMELVRSIRAKTSAASEKQRLSYQTAVEQARHEDFSDMAELQLIYKAGVDHAGVPVVLVVGRNLPARHIDLDRVLLYVVHVMDGLTDRVYNVVYLHGGVDEDNQPNTSWLKTLFKTFSSKYRDNLKTFYVVEPTLWLKLVLWVGKSFSSRTFGAKVAFLDAPTDLHRVAPSLKLPAGSATCNQHVVASNQDDHEA